MSMAEVERISVPEAARRFAIPGPRIYELLLSHELDGGPDRDGSVTVSVASIREYVARQLKGGAL